MHRTGLGEKPDYRVFIVDDSPEDREVLRQYLSQWDRRLEIREFASAASLRQALREGAEDPPDCILLDYHLPDEDAPALLAELGGPDSLRYPVVVMTGDRGAEHGPAVLRLGAQDFMGKDWMNAGSLTRTLENAIERFALLCERAEQESRLRAFLDASGDAVGLLGEQGFLECNPSTLRIFGCRSREEFLGRDPRAFSPPLQPGGRESSALAQEHIATALRQGTHRFEWQHLRLDGTPFHADVVLTAVQIGGRCALQACLRDITVQKESEAEIRRLNAMLAARVAERTVELAATTDALHDRERQLYESAERLRLAQRGAKAGVWEWDVLTDTVTWTPELAALWGDSGGALSGSYREFALRICPEDRAEAERVRNEAVSAREPFDMDFRIATASGETRWLNCQGRAEYDEAGQPVRLSGMLFDITTRKSIEEALRSSEERLNLAQEAGGIAIWDWDLQADRATVSKPYYALYGLPTGMPLRYTDFLALVHPDDRARVNASFQASITGGADYREELRIIRADDGAEVWVAGTGRIEFDAGGLPRRALGVVQDITQRKRVELALRKSEQRFRMLFEQASDGIFLTDTEGRFLDVNVAGCQIHGYSRPELLQLSIVDLLAPQELPRVEPLLSACLAGQVVRGEWQARRKDGSKLSVEVSAQRLPEGLLLGIVRDVTERVRMEAGQRAADRRKDEFLATLAHELRNPLAAIRSTIELLRGGALNPANTERFHGILERQAEHLERLVGDLTDTSRISRGMIELERDRHELSELVAQALEMSQPLIKRRSHTVILDPGPTALWVDGDAVRLVQVFANLVSNAAKYMAEGGVIRVTIERRQREAVVQVRDEGIGIHASELPRLFALFHRAAAVAPFSESSLGVGLYLARQILTLHAGRVEAHSEGLGKGSTFSAYLPLTSAPTAAVPDLKAKSTIPSAMQRILVVDDNQDAADSLAFLLQVNGATVEVAYDGEAALAKLAGFKPEAILLDLGMPGLSGYEVARRIRQVPETQGIVLVALTGWDQEEERRRTREAGFAHHLVKPVSLKTLQTLLTALAPGGAESRVPLRG